MNRQQATKVALNISELRQQQHTIRESIRFAEESILKHALAHDFDLLPPIVFHHENMKSLLRFNQLGIDNRWAKLREANYTVRDFYDMLDEHAEKAGN